MVITAAGLAAIPRDTLEAARTDGATELQVFRRITVPLLAPVLTVVLVTQIIACLKIFDLVLSVAPGSSRRRRDVLAFAMWRRSFCGQNVFGLGSAISTFLLLLFIPFLSQRAPLPRGGEVDGGRRRGAPSGDRGERRRSSCAMIAKAPVHLVLSFIALLWLIPTAGLFITSLLTPADQAEGGWWNFLFTPSTWTLENYTNMFDNDSIAHALIVTAQVTRSALRSCRSSSPRWPRTRSRGSSSQAATGSSSPSSRCCSCRSRWR